MSETQTKGRLLALVAVTAFVDGARHTFKPGEAIPEEALPEHDLAYLKKTKSIIHESDVADDEAAAQKLVKAGLEEFRAARERAIAHQQSLQVSETTNVDAPASPAGEGAPAVATAEGDAAAADQAKKAASGKKSG